MRIVRLRLICLIGLLALLGMSMQKQVKTIEQQTKQFKKSLVNYETSLRQSFGLSKKQMSVLLNESNIKNNLVGAGAKLEDLDRFVTAKKERKLNDIVPPNQNQAPVQQQPAVVQNTTAPQTGQRKLTLKDYIPEKKTLILQPSEITFLSNMVNPKEQLSLEDKVKAVQEGAAQCKSKKQRKLYFEMINSVFESSITKNVIGGILALTAARVYGSNFRHYNHRIRNLKSVLEGVQSVLLMRKQQKHGYVKSIQNVIDDMEKLYGDFGNSMKHRIYMLNALIEKHFGESELDGMLINHDSE